MSPEKHFLARRDNNGLLEVKVFRDQQVALKAYEQAERDLWLNLSLDKNGEEVCLFGADSLTTLMQTHASWFAPETLDIPALCGQTTPRNPPNPSATVEPQPTKEDLA